MHAQGILYEDAYRAQNAYRGGVEIVGMPPDREALAAYSVVVIVNVDAPALGPKRLEALRQFVDGGGGLVVLGGEWAYGRGGYADTPLAEMLPATFADEYRIPVTADGALLKPDAASTWSWKLAFEQAPRAFYMHGLAPRKEAKVELRADNQPVLISGKFGEGPSRRVRAYCSWEGAAGKTGVLGLGRLAESPGTGGRVGRGRAPRSIRQIDCRIETVER